MVVLAKDWCRWIFAGKDSPEYRVDWCVIYRKGVGNIDWRGNWECTKAVDVGRCLEGYSCALGGGRFLGHVRAKFPTWLHRQITKPSVVQKLL